MVACFHSGPHRSARTLHGGKRSRLGTTPKERTLAVDTVCSVGTLTGGELQSSVSLGFVPPLPMQGSVPGGTQT
jgi:hypothetical protein